MYDTGQTSPATARYGACMGTAAPVTGFTDLKVVLGASPGKTCARSGLMLARVLPCGLFELLSTAAWARALGYPAQELSGKWLHDLMLEASAAGDVVASLLDETDAQPLDVTLRCKDERRKSFRLHRRFDPYDHAMFVLADEVA
jgi:hypothetical protein